MKAPFRNALLAIFCLAASSAQCAVVYSPGPASQSPPLYIPFGQNVDFDCDGLADYSVWSPGALTTMDLQTSFLLWPYYVGAAGSNQMLNASYDAFLQPFGAEISSNPPSSAIWATPWFDAGLAAYWSSSGGRIVDGQVVQSGWDGPLADLGVAYLPVHFYAADGPHYGWIRVRLPSPDAAQGGFLLEIAPVVVDWAYETNPGNPIRAGDIDSTEESLQFTVTLRAPSPRPHQQAQAVGTASFILTGNSLRGELSLAGQFSSAQILDPNHPHGKGRLVSDLGPPSSAAPATPPSSTTPPPRPFGGCGPPATELLV